MSGPGNPSKPSGGTEARRILLVRLSHLGDVLHALPVFDALRAAYPSAELGWVVQPEFAALLEDLSGLERVFHFGRRDGLAAWPRLRQRLLEWSPSWVVDAQGNSKSAMVALASGAARRSGLALCDWTERFAGQSLTDRAQPARGPHAIDRMLALARHVAPGAEARVELELSSERLACGAAQLWRRLPRAGGRLWILCLAKPDDVRSWPARHFASLALELFERGGRVLILSGPEEAAVGAALAERVGERRAGAGALAHWVGQRGLPELAGLFAAAARAGARLVACDTGPTHLAAACGLPVRLLAGPQDPARTGPWPPALELAAASDSSADESSAAGSSSTGSSSAGTSAADPSEADFCAASPHRALHSASPPECAPCLERRCDHPRGPVCLSELEPLRVAGLLLREP